MLKKCCKGDGHSRQPGFLQLSVLCAAFFANEITVTFELIYMVSVERLLSLPLQFVSLPGVVASASSFVIVPLMGRYTDSGNRHRRRSAMVVLSGALQFTGALLLLTACAKFIHIQTQSLEVNSKQNHGLLSEASKMEKEVNEFSFSKVFGGNVNETSTQFESDVPFNWTIPPNRNNDEDIEGESHSISSALTACLALVSFSVMAVGFDIGTSSIRAFVLDCVPPEAHSNVLSIGVMMSSLGGCVFALLGRIDISSLVGHNTDPTLIRGVFLSSFLMLTLLVTVPVTLIFGGQLKFTTGDSAYYQTTLTENKSSKTKFDRCNFDCAEQEAFGVYQLENVNAHVETLRPLVINGQGKCIREKDEKHPGCGECGDNKLNKGLVNFQETCVDQKMENNTERYLKVENQKSTNCTGMYGDKCETVPNDSISRTTHANSDISGGHCIGVRKEPLKVIKKEKGESTPLMFSDFRNFPEHKDTKWASFLRNIKTARCRLLFFLCLVTFFSSGSSISFEVYFSTFLSVGVFKGDPEAPLGSDLKHNFDQGTLVASEGTLIFMVTFFLYNFAHWKVVQRTGLIFEYLAISLLAMPFLLAMALLKHLSLFYVVVFLNGIYRNILFTTPFVMATELVDGEKGHVSYELHSTGNGTTEPPACSNTSDQTPSIDLRSADGPELEDHASYGSTIAIVGAMLPLSDLVLSCMMGPLLEATSDPALPMLYGVTSGLAAALALVAIAAYKRRAGV